MMRRLPVQCPSNPAVAMLPLTRGYVALVDWNERDRTRVSSWRASPAKCGVVYAVGTIKEPDGKSRTLFLHRWLMNAPRGFDVDHINHDGLDNRLCNLRIVKRGANIANQRNDGSRNQFGYRGVSFVKGSFYANIMLDGRQIHSRKCATAIEAARAWDELAIKHYDGFVQLNFPAQQRAA